MARLSSETPRVASLRHSAAHSRYSSARSIRAKRRARCLRVRSFRSNPCARLHASGQAAVLRCKVNAGLGPCCGRSKMAKLWHAFYFNSLDRSAGPSRTAMIEADHEDQAGWIAVAQMGRSLRVDVSQPIWHSLRSTFSMARDSCLAPFAMSSGPPAIIASRNASQAPVQ